jgi:hypothetical protein
MDRHWMARIARKRGATAFTFRAVVYCDRPTERLLAHEAVHAADQRRWGILLNVAGRILEPRDGRTVAAHDAPLTGGYRSRSAGPFGASRAVVEGAGHDGVSDARISANRMR